MSSLKEKRKRIQFVYKTTNLLNGTYYIGVHSTWNIDDGYLGSGKRLGRAINKYGKENFKREILAFFETNREAYEYEVHLVNEELLKDELCLNLKPGGRGGFSEEMKSNGGKIGGNIHKIRLILDETYAKNFKKFISERNTNLKIGFLSNPLDWTGKSHTEETKKKMRESSKGNGLKEKNSQFGTCWITNGSSNMKINKNESIPEGWTLGRKIK